MKFGVCNSRFFEHFDRPERTLCFYGGGGSGKSLSIMQHFVIQLCNGDGKRRGIFRKTMTSMTNSTYWVLKEILEDWGIPFKEHKSDHNIKVYSRNGEIYKYMGKDEDWDGAINSLSYLGLEDPERIKGAEFAEIWLEEATEFTEKDYNQLLIRLGRTSDDVRIFTSFNPIDKDHWLVRKVIKAQSEPDSDMFVHHSTYKDNLKFLSQSMIDTLESFIDIDENFYRVYALGLPGILKGQIYKNWNFSDPAKWPVGYKSGMHFYGVDFGFNAPMAMCEIWYYDGEYYLKEVLYESGMTTNDMIARYEGLGISTIDEIYCDSAEPDRIQELCNSGYNAKPSKKAVKPGIDFVKGSTVHVDATSSPNMETEYNNYKWKETKDGDSLDEPVKAFDHILDAVRYAMFTAPTEPVGAISNVQTTRPRFSSFSSSRPTF